ncbi:GDP-mannose 4,6-dehydratase [Maioricimonas rarisocia]|uniref:GDP-mannose 4,6-dehydratase n=1 Tax=Maioricimonas rarisocia TaxID=2528026 RepID=A0A517Z8D9_9PLAN|nr:GDP-mannose 4,6-dehydratase [Maioricimonas rarisocia]QDU38701.1 GDP-mannose 4,6-dehydratase [Maioricimonas rarisocia]
MPRRALITGVTGQDGSYLAELLLDKGYEVQGTTRNVDSESTRGLHRLVSERGGTVRLHESSLQNDDEVTLLLDEVAPDEIYHLAAQSHVGLSFEKPLETLDANAGVTLRLLEAVRTLQGRGRDIRFFHAASSEMFGRPTESPQTERTPFVPRNPYATSKVCAFHLVANYRETHGLYACSGILFNHESPRRPERFVTRKVTLAAARIAAGLQETLTLGNLDIGRDWGFAGDYVDAMWRMLHQEQPTDLVIATGRWHSLEEFLERAFRRVNLDWRDHVRQDPALMRPAESGRLVGDASLARERLGWQPTTTFEELVDRMVDADMQWVVGRS